MVREIPLTQGYVALVDDEDYEYLIKFKWHVEVLKRKDGSLYFYASRCLQHRNSKQKQINIRMHRDILKPEKDQIIDHKDGNGLNNQRNNLRVCNDSQNNANKKIVNKSGEFKGVTFAHNKWFSRIKIRDEQGKSKNLSLGSFKTEREAAIFYDLYAIKYHGEFAVLNFEESREIYKTKGCPENPDIKRYGERKIYNAFNVEGTLKQLYCMFSSPKICSFKTFIGRVLRFKWDIEKALTTKSQRCK